MYLEPNANHKLCAIDDETGESLGELCEEVYIAEEHVNLLTRDFEAQIILWQDGEPVPIRMSRDELCGNPFPILYKKGLHMLNTPDNKEVLMKYIMGTDRDEKKLYTHDKLGFHELGCKTVFLANEVIGDCKKVSHYVKPAITAPKGTLDTWLAIVNQEIIGHPNLELALAIGASAPVAHLLQETKIIAEVPIWCLIGESSTGKTTCTRMMASIYGSAEESSGLIKDFNASDRAIIAMLQDSGIIHIIDESTIAGKKDYSNLFYKLSKGIDKLICNTGGSLKERQTFTGTVVITGEQSPLTQSTADLGLHARVRELTRSWTDDANHARRISQGFRTNYGTAIVPYAKYLLKWQDRPDLLERAFNQELERFRAKIGDISGVEERLLNMYATVTLSARLLNKAVGLKLKISGMRDLLAEVHRKAPKKEAFAQELYDTVMDKAVLHGAYFPKTEGKRKNEIIPNSLWGEYAKRGKRDVLWISGIKFREFTEERFVNPAPYLNELHRQELLVKFSDGYTTKHRLGHSEVRCYCFYMS